MNCRDLLSSLGRWMLIGVSILFALILAAWGVGLRINLTESLPRGLYFFVDGPVDPGDLVAVCLQEDRARFGFERGYLPAGPCPGNVAPLLKRVAAAEGESVELRDDGVWLDGHRLQLPAPPKDSRGRPLEPLSNGLYRLQVGELWETRLDSPERAIEAYRQALSVDDRCVEAMRNATDLPVTVKHRIGIDDLDIIRYIHIE